MSDCASACENTCADPSLQDKVCTTECSPGCVCKEGLVRNHKNQCVEISKCTNESCEPNEEFSECGSHCEPTCAQPQGPQICTADCVAGCKCIKGFVKDHNGFCVSIQNCTDESCGNNQYYTLCGTACPKTCDNMKIEMCTSQCVAGCFCEEPFVKDDAGTCVHPLECTNSTCALPLEQGSCEASMMVYGFDVNENKCVEWSYGGCEGNENRFDTMEQCEKACHTQKEETPKPSSEARCQQPIVTGKCRAYIEKFAFDPEQNRCVTFTYGGCDANENNFDTMSECDEHCPPLADHTTTVGIETDTDNAVQKMCNQSIESGMCMAYMERFAYHPEKDQCEMFIYGGCGGNENNFLTKKECEEKCMATVMMKIVQPIEKCNQHIVTGPCRGRFEKWAYNSSSLICQKFTYGGCGGNYNRFETEKECQSECYNRIVQPVEICNLHMEKGPCRGFLKKYGYNVETKQCEMFVYGGCQGNSNRFDTREHCEYECLHIMPNEDVGHVITTSTRVEKYTQAETASTKKLTVTVFTGFVIVCIAAFVV